MIAEAVKAVRPDANHVSVDLQTIRFTDAKRGMRYTYLTPRIAQIALLKFDQGITPTEFEFQLRGGQVTRSGSSQKRKALNEQEGKKGQRYTPREMREKRRQAARARESLPGKAVLVDRKQGGNVAERVGGKTPPLQNIADDVPFTRRRAFGLRGLEY